MVLELFRTNVERKAVIIIDEKTETMSSQSWWSVWSLCSLQQLRFLTEGQAELAQKENPDGQLLGLRSPLMRHSAPYTLMKSWNKKNFSQTPLPPPALLDSLKLHFYFLGLQLLFPSDF